MSTEEEDVSGQEQEQEQDFDEEVDETPDDKKDLLWCLTKPLEEMTLDEQIEAIARIRELRKVRIAASKRKSTLDLILQQLTPEKASSLLKQLEALTAPKETLDAPKD